MKTVSLKAPLLAAGMAVAALTGAMLPATQAQAQVYVRVAPPAPQVEVVPPPRHGWIWAPGHYQWRHGRYVWVRGMWVRERAGYGYVAPTWVMEGNRWVYRPSRWERHGPPPRRHGPPPPHRH